MSRGMSDEESDIRLLRDHLGMDERVRRFARNDLYGKGPRGPMDASSATKAYSDLLARRARLRGGTARPVRVPAAVPERPIGRADLLLAAGLAASLTAAVVVTLAIVLGSVP